MSFRPTSNAAPGTLFTARGLEACGIQLLESICEDRHRTHVRTLSQGERGPRPI